jgi:hypothetical protein
VPAAGGASTLAAETHEDTVEGQIGNPAYLRLALEAMAAEAKLLGLNEPEKQDHRHTFTDAELPAMHKRFDEIMRNAAARALEAVRRAAASLPASTTESDASAS